MSSELLDPEESDSVRVQAGEDSAVTIRFEKEIRTSKDGSTNEQVLMVVQSDSITVTTPLCEDGALKLIEALEGYCK